MDINEIFKDLGMMIHEQGDVIGKPYMWNFMRWKQATLQFPCGNFSNQSNLPPFLSLGLPGVKSTISTTDKAPPLALSETDLTFGSYWLKWPISCI